MDNSSARDRPATLVLYDAFSDSIKRFLSWLEESMTSLEETLSDESIQMEYLNGCREGTFTVEDGSPTYFHNVILIGAASRERVTVAVGTDGVTISKKVNDRSYSKLYRIETIKRYSWSHWDGAFRIIVREHKIAGTKDNYCVILETPHHQDMFDTLAKCIEKRLRAQQEHANDRVRLQSEHQADQPFSNELIILDNSANSHPIEMF